MKKNVKSWIRIKMKRIRNTDRKPNKNRIKQNSNLSLFCKVGGALVEQLGLGVQALLVQVGLGHAHVQVVNQRLN